MKKQLFITFSICALSICGYSQNTFQHVFSRNNNVAEVYGGQQTTDGGFISAGLNQISATDFDYLIVKTNATGDTSWTKTYGGIGDEECYAMQQTNDGGYIFAGIDSSSGLGSYNVYLVKTDVNGDTLWTKSYGGSSYDFAQAIQQTSDHGYIIAGYTGSFGAANADAYLIKTDVNGVVTWSKTYGGLQSDYAFAVKQTADGGYIVAGITSSFGVTAGNPNYNDLYLFKTDGSGVVTWSKTYGRNGDDWAFGVIQTKDGGYAVTGHTNTDSLAATSDLCLIKTDANGDTLFTKSFGGTNYDKGTCIIETSDSGLVIGGSTYSFGNGASDMYLLKTNANGNLLFNTSFGGGGNDWTYAISQTNNKGFLLSGYTDNFGVSNSSFYVITTDSSGNSGSCNNAANSFDSTGIAIVNNAATITNNAATITSNKTNTVIGNGVTFTDACPTTGIKQIVNNTDQLVIVYPNPSNGGDFYLRTASMDANTQVIIYNQLGQVVLAQPVNALLTHFNLNGSTGLYELRMISNNQVIYQTKIVKQQ